MLALRPPVSRWTCTFSTEVRPALSRPASSPTLAGRPKSLEFCDKHGLGFRVHLSTCASLPGLLFCILLSLTFCLLTRISTKCRRKAAEIQKRHSNLKCSRFFFANSHRNESQSNERPLESSRLFRSRPIHKRGSLTQTQMQKNAAEALSSDLAVTVSFIPEFPIVAQ